MPLAALQLDLEMAQNTGGDARALGRALAADPLRLDLPALPAALPSPELLRAIGALWFDAQLDAAGINRCAGWLADRRTTLALPGEDRAALEAHAARRGSWLTGATRDQLAGRLFAIGPVSATISGDAARFVPALAALASALVASGPRPAGPAIGPQAGIVRASLELAGIVATVAAETLATTASLFTDQLRQSIALLSRPGVCNLIRARDFWDAVRRLQGAQAPDFRRLLDQGRHGQTILRWLADAVPALEHEPPFGPDVTPTAVAAATVWIRSCGLPVGEGSR